MSKKTMGTDQTVFREWRATWRYTAEGLPGHLVPHISGAQNIFECASSLDNVVDHYVSIRKLLEEYRLLGYNAV
jgi:hypothetical protein